MTRTSLGATGLTLLVLLAPLASDGTPFETNNCSRATTSYAAGIQGPTKGDEAFFSSSALSSAGTAAVVFLLDNSGSMMDLPQCNTGSSTITIRCSAPSLAAPGNPSGPNYIPKVVGSCDFSTDSSRRWMTGGETTDALKSLNVVAPNMTSFADPGYAMGSGWVNDSPPWSPAGTWTNSGTDPVAPACAGHNNCLFDPGGYYDWTSSPWTETTATKVKGDPCAIVDDAGVTRKDFKGNNLVAGTACSDCYKSKGIYAWRITYYSSNDRFGNPRFTTENGRFLARGTWLNANPPKFVGARRAIKQLVKIDPNDRKARDYARYALATFWDQGYLSDASWDTTLDTSNDPANDPPNTGGIKSGDGARLIVPLGPDCDGETVANSMAKHVENRQAIVDALNRNTVRSDTDIGVIKFSSNTPLAESLFNIMQYFSADGANGVHHKAFGQSLAYPGKWDKVGYPTNPAIATFDPGADFRETSTGAVNAAWVTTANASTPSRQSSICYSCQVSAAIVVTDGQPNNESALPLDASDAMASHGTMPLDGNGNLDLNGAWDFQKWTPQLYRDSCGGNRGATGDGCKSYLPLVALYGQLIDFRPGPNAATGDAMVGSQKIMTHTVSFGTKSTAAKKVLQATATMGAGKWTDTSSASELENALVASVDGVVKRATSFSASSANALQTSRNFATETFFARFKPFTSISWEGHLIQATLFDEFAMGCDPTKEPSALDADKVDCGSTRVYPNFNGDVDGFGHNICNGVYLVDQDCKEIHENQEGDFILTEGSGSANLPWDAGRALSTTGTGAYRSAADADAGTVKARKIQTCVSDPAANAALGTTSCTMVDFTVANVAKLQPTMGLDRTSCEKILKDSQLCPTCAAASLTATDLTNCAKLVIRFVRGWDVMDADADGCRGPENSGTACGGSGEQRDDDGNKLLWKLGDIFHSTPAVMKPPIDELRCDLGYEPQCVSTLHSPAGLAGQTPYDSYVGASTGSTVDAYERWRLDNKERRRLVLAGANDGMLHAFHAGDAVTTDATKQEPLTLNWPYSRGDASEQWAFIPPDLLPRLKGLLSGHRYMVDGSTMLRDVWVDGTTQGSSTIGTADGKKQRGEFHTVAIITERSGGTQLTALDVTDPAAPRYLWTFPPPGSDDARYMAQSWSDFAPRPPPIGPVRLANGSGTEERWIVMVNGGYDPALVKGRAVFMVDVWTGKTLWRFTNDDFKAMQTGTKPASMFPVPAAVALTDIGDLSKPAFDADGFFDTATWGDLGGQVWVARFHQPGTIDATTGRVTNWFAARTFEQQRRTDDVQSMRADGGTTGPLGQVRSEFFYMTANAYEATTRTLRVFLGSGNREHMLEAGDAPGCGPDNVLSCLRSACSYVKTETVDNFGTCSNTATFEYTGGALTQSASTTTCATLPATCAPAAGQPFTSRTTFDFTCNGIASTQLSPTLSCDAAGLCTYREIGDSGDTVANNYVSGSNLTPSGNHNRFYGMWAYGKAAGKMFDDPDPDAAALLAKAFDGNRFTDVPYAGTCSGTKDDSCSLVNTTDAVVTYDATGATSAITTSCGASTLPCAATNEDPGWYYQYGMNCPITSCDPAPPWTDEKTAAGSNLILGCAAWSGFRPIGSNTTAGGPCDVSIGNPTSYSYLANFVTGTPSMACGWADNGVIRRSAERSTWSPPSAPSVRVTVNDKGQINYSTLQLDPGAPPAQKTVGSRTDVSEPVYWLEVPRSLHQCRHVDAASCP